MASEIEVQTLKGPSGGANANKVLIPSGHTLDASEGFIPPAGSAVNYEKFFMPYPGSNEMTLSSESAYCLVGATYTKKFSNSLLRVDAYYNMYRSGTSGYSRESILFRHGVSNYFTSNSIISGYNVNLEQNNADNNPAVEQVKENGQVAMYVQSSLVSMANAYQNRFIMGTFKYDSSVVSIALAVGQTTGQIIRHDRYSMPTLHVTEIKQ